MARAKAKARKVTRLRIISRYPNLSNSKDTADIVTEMFKQVPQEKIYEIARCVQARCMGQEEAPSSWKIVNLVVLQKADAEPKKGIRSYRAIALTSVMWKWYATSILFTIGKGKTDLK